jgi:hypothetical protein
VLSAILPYIILPTSTVQLTSCYLVWVIPYAAINIVWDIRSQRTEPFHISKMQSKMPVLHSAAALCSSVLVIGALLSKTIGQLSEETAVPLVLASLSGILQAFSSLCPYEIEKPFQARIAPISAAPAAALVQDNAESQHDKGLPGEIPVAK